MRGFFVVLVVVGLFLLCMIGNSEYVQAQDVYSVQLQGFAWNHYTLSALVVTSENESWWDYRFINDTARAIGQWNEAVAGFAANYSDFSYLSNVVIDWTMSNTSVPGYDLYLNWTEFSLSNSSDEVGLAKTYVNGDNSIINCSISLAVHTSQGNALRAVDMQNIALHELGHSLGLGHSNYTGDLMYAVYTLGGSPEGISTLDAYGVGRVFAWIPNASSFRPVSRWLADNSVVLPSMISYRDLPVSAQNTPPQTIADNPVVQFLVMVLGVLAEPIIAVPVLIVILLFVVLSAIPRRRKRYLSMADS